MGITSKQKAVYDYIISYIRKNGHAPTQMEIQRHFSLKSLGSVQRYIKQLENSGHLKRDLNACRGLMPTNEQEIMQEPETSNFFTQIPVLGQIAAGPALPAISREDEEIPIPNNLLKKGKRHFALEVKGDSMIDEGIKDSDLAICQAQSTANTGEIVAAQIDGSDVTLKKFYPLSKNQIELRPANENYETLQLDSSNHSFEILGILTGLIRSY